MRSAHPRRIGGQVELHFYKEKEPRRRQIADAVVRAGVRASIYTAPIARDRIAAVITNVIHVEPAEKA